MKKSLILPFVGLAVLAICTYFFINKSEKENKKNIAIPSLLFETEDFYDKKTLNQKDLDKFYIVNFFASWCKPCLAEHPLLM